MVVANVENDHDSSLVARLDELPQAVRSARALIDGEIVRGAISPVGGAFELRDRHQFDGVHPQLNEMIYIGESVDQGSGIGLPEAQRADVQLVDDQVLELRRKRMLGGEFVGPEVTDERFLARVQYHFARVANDRAALRPLKVGGQARIGLPLGICIPGANLFA